MEHDFFDVAWGSWNRMRGLSSTDDGSTSTSTSQNTDAGSSARKPFTTIDGKPLVIPTPPPTAKPQPKSNDSKEADADAEKTKETNLHAVPIASNESDSNKTYTWNHYDIIQEKSNGSYVAPWKSTAFENITTDALQKNLSTTKTPLLPSERKPPDNWVKIVGGLFGGVAVSLILATIIRNIYANNRRKNYEEIQSLVV